jgi:hypothetical protein
MNTIKNRFTGIMQPSETQTIVTTTNPYSGIDAVKLNTIKRTISGMIDEINSILPIVPTAFHSVKAHLEAHYVQVTSVLATLPQTSQDVITDSLDWAHDVLVYEPNIVYHMTCLSALDISISHAKQHNFRYLTTATFTGDDSVIAIYYKVAKRGLNFVELKGTLIYDNYVKDVIASGAVFVQGIPF